MKGRLGGSDLGATGQHKATFVTNSKLPELPFSSYLKGAAESKDSGS
jgi:hypothetical protein